MNLSELIDLVYTLADEEGTPDTIAKWLNNGMSLINVELETNLPYFDLSTSSEDHVIPRKYLETVLVPFAVGRLKQTDASQFEFTEAYAQFREALGAMKTRYVVPEEYKDTDTNHHVIDYSGENSWHRW